MLETLSNYFKYSENNLLDNNLLDICSNLNEGGYSDELEIPEIVCIGTQSSGKSRTLNNIMRYSILPVGNVMTTKTPIRVELRNNDRNSILIGYVEDRFVMKYCSDLGKIDYEIIRNTITTITNDEYYSY